MSSEFHQRQFDEALDRIEGGVLPEIGTLLEKMLLAVEAGSGATCSLELDALARQIESLTDALSRAAPDAIRDSDAA